MRNISVLRQRVDDISAVVLLHISFQLQKYENNFADIRPSKVKGIYTCINYLLAVFTKKKKSTELLKIELNMYRVIRQLCALQKLICAYIYSGAINADKNTDKKAQALIILAQPALATLLFLNEKNCMLVDIDNAFESPSKQIGDIREITGLIVTAYYDADDIANVNLYLRLFKEELAKLRPGLADTIVSQRWYHLMKALVAFRLQDKSEGITHFHKVISETLDAFDYGIPFVGELMCVSSKILDILEDAGDKETALLFMGHLHSFVVIHLSFVQSRCSVLIMYIHYMLMRRKIYLVTKQMRKNCQN
jgi:hypothetical protein